MMKQKILLAALLCFIEIAGCNSPIALTPANTLTNFFNALAKNDLAKAKQLCTVESSKVIDIFELSGYMSPNNKAEEKFDPTQLSLGTVKEEGDIATIPVTEKKSGITLNYQLKKVGGFWKVVFDFDTVIKILNDAASILTNNSVDSLSTSFDKIKNISVDSLQTLFDKNKQAMDSLKKLIDIK